MTGTTTRVLLADDQPVVRAGLRMILEQASGIEIVGEAGDGAEAFVLAERLSPDVVVMDVRMPGVDGIEGTRRIVAAGLASKVLVLTTFDTDDIVARALQAGASGFLLKDIAAGGLVEAVATVANGDAVLSPQVTRRVIAGYAAAQPAGAPTDQPGARPAPGGAGAGPAPALLTPLTQRESEVLDLVAAGLSNAEIAASLFLAETTVKSHVSAVLVKLGVRDRVQAVVWWHRHRRP
jgi:DNA-binding NarL/FixJ family response regulator